MKFPLRRRGWIHAAGPRRIALEAGIVTFALTLPLALLFVGDPEFRAVLDLGTMEGGVTGGVLGAARRRRGGEARRLRREVTGAVVLAVGVWVGVSLANLAGVARMPWTASADWEASTLLVEAPVFGALAAVPAVATYGIGRAALWAWPTWNRARRTRLLWALTHAQLVVSLTLAVVIGTLLATATAAALIGTAIADPRPDYLPPAAAMADAGPLAVALTWLTIGFLPAVIGPFVLSLVVGFVLIPPVALISARVLRRTTARLEDLADATAALRTGDLTARVPVGGEDEVARLQTDFNAMAAHLERSLADLGAERDAVARLLADRRELVAAVSHELRTPVATLRGYLDSALGRWDGAPPPTLRADLGVMATETERLARLIDDLFALSRAEVGRLSIAPRPTDVGALLRRTAEAAAPSPGRAARSRCWPRPRPPCRRRWSTPTAWSRSSATCSPTPSATPRPAVSSCSAPLSRGTRWSSRSRTPATGSPPPTSPTSGTASIARTATATATAVGPVSAWPWSKS